MSERYIIKSGNGYVENRHTLAMVSGPDETESALLADRMSLSEAEKLYHEMLYDGLDVAIMELRAISYK